MKSEVYYDEVPARPAPVTERGAIAWIRENLFSTAFDSVLTIGGIALVIITIISTITWAVTGANWYAIMFNFRSFMVGRYEPELEWRVILVAIMTLFAAGMVIRMWINKLARFLLITIILIIAVIQLVPGIIYNNVDIPHNYFSAGEISITSGQDTITPAPYLAFLAKEGETVSLRFASEAITDDDTFAQLNGFMDLTTRQLWNAAVDRVELIADRAELEDQLQRDETETIPIFTAEQREYQLTELDRMDIPAPVIEEYAINDVVIQLNLLDGATLEPIGEAITLESADDIASFTIPADGWYVLEKLQISPEDTAGVAILETTGIHPMLRSLSFVNYLETGDGTIVENEFVDTYVRMLDNYRLVRPLPQLDGEDLPFTVVTQNQYRGSRDLQTYLRIYTAPFLERVSKGLTILLLAGVAGYATAYFLSNVRGKKKASSYATTLLLLLPVVIWILVAGVSVKGMFNLSLVAAAITFVIFIYYVGMGFGLTPRSIVVFLVGTGLIMFAPQLVFENTYGFGLLALVNFAVIVPAFLALMTGSGQYGVREMKEIAKPLMIVGGLMAFFYLVPVILTQFDIVSLTDSHPDWFLRTSDQRTWSGLLLTLMLTVFGIMIAFPIGISMALGRRSNLPAIKYICVLYIELIRGSPFITVLFFMQLFIPLINPEFAEIPNSIRALVGVILFSSAYLAENVRGGLQALPPGQPEAARALGLGGWQITLFITLPQALRIVIPALVGQFISLFKDTSLVAIVGLIDLTGFVNTMVVQSEFIGTRAEGLLFITMIYFVFSYMMGYVSRLLEASGSGSTRKL
mgnify:CR=1 FL=1